MDLTTNTGKQKAAAEILDYWAVLDHLDQATFDKTLPSAGFTEQDWRKTKQGQPENRKKSTLSYCNAFVKTFRRINDFSLSETGRQAVFLTGRDECKLYRVQMGKIRRLSCLMSVAVDLNLQDLDTIFPEKDQDKIAGLAFNIDSTSRYMPGSLEVSPIFWTAAKNDKSSFTDISKDTYDKDMKKLEEKNGLLQKDPEHDDALIPVQVTSEVISRLNQKILGAMQDRITEKLKMTEYAQLAEPENWDLQTFRVKVWTGESETEIPELIDKLRMCFFQNGLQELREWIQKTSPERPEWQRIIQFILAEILPDHEKPKRENVIGSDADFQESGQWEQTMYSLFDIRNVPSGKWPSRYPPSLMQQGVLNCMTLPSYEFEQMFPSRVFSVNGPPGTGKTTMLKDFIADTVVKRAAVLSRYDNPEEAFNKRNFLKGDGQGGRYDPQIPFWGSFKDIEAAQSMMVVASCNNGAVENISKELPLALDSGQAEEKDNLELSDWNSVLHEFTPARSTVKCNDKDDVFFTEFSDRLFEAKTKGISTWGTISAAAGKKANIGKLYYKVLNPLLKMSEGSVLKQAAVQEYKTVRSQFVRQMEKVREIQNSLIEIQTFSLNRSFPGQSAEDLKTSAGELDRKTAADRNALHEFNETHNSEISEYDEKLLELKQKQNEKNRLLEDRNHKQLDIENLENECSSARLDLLTEQNRKLNGFEKLLGLGKRRQGSLEQAVQLLEARLNQTRNECRNTEDSLYRLINEIDLLESEIRGYEPFINSLKEHKDYLEGLLKNDLSQTGVLTKEIRTLAAFENQFSLPGQKPKTDLNRFYLSEILSDDHERSAKAHAQNPSLSEEFNREREKLFYLALQLQKQFVLSSQTVRNNLVTLCEYWKLRTTKDDCRVSFHLDDTEQMLPSLFQTLSLVVPVISTTFASYGTMFKDIKKPDCLGVLLIDEAGQAAPYQAAAAVFKASKTIVVGDPDQLEPVVTDDLDVIRRHYLPDSLKKLQDKDLSVQTAADQLNPFGTWRSDGEWKGFPLVVHRRCLSPMFDISNEVAYDGILRKQTREPSSMKSDLFLEHRSCWYDIIGDEAGNKNHSVRVQNELAVHLLEKHLQTNPEGSLYIISPFKSVVNELRISVEKALTAHYQKTGQNKKLKSVRAEAEKMTGTVHTFQGKEADEVIIVLGCDRKALPAANWVGKNLVNVVVSRAKYRLYMIGDYDLWRQNNVVKIAQKHLERVKMS